MQNIFLTVPLSFQSTAGNSFCISCGSGATSISPNASTFTSTCVCQAGYTLAISGSSCESCPSGYYKSASGNGVCSPCGTGATVKSAAGASYAAACDCLAGYQLSANASSCATCPAGSYKGSVGNTACVSCGAGAARVSATGTNFSTSCQCSAGFQPDVIAAPSQCVACPVQTFKDVQSNAPCTACPPNSVSAAGQTSQSACTCSAGYEGDATVSSAQTDSCRSCPYGYYKTAAGNTGCTACLVGNTTLQRASTLASDCSERCGNCVVRGGETCDDCNGGGGDGCSSSCVVEPGWSCPTAGAACVQCGFTQVPANFTGNCSTYTTPLTTWLQTRGGAVATSSPGCGTGLQSI